LEQFGQVIETTNETATVNLQRHLTCESCGKCGILSGSGRRDLNVEALNPIQAKNGQRVILETDDRQILFISFMLYIVPVAALLAGIYLGLAAAGRFNPTMNHELFAVLTGLAMMSAVFMLIRLWDSRVKNNPKYKPVITGLIEDKELCGDQSSN
jgi:sigma-E factor negative regulatory protein RseC